jgi:argininosuccinate lyase
MQIKTVTPPNLIKGVLSLVVGARVTAELNDATASHMSLLQRRYAFPQLTSSFEATLAAVRLLSSSLTSLTVDREAARQRVINTFSTAADLAGTIVEDCKLPWRSAHQICGILFRHRDERGLAQSPITSEALDEAATEYFGHALGLRQKRIDEALDPDLYVRRRSGRGGSAPKEVRRRLRVAGRQLASHRHWLSERRSETLVAASALEAAIDKLLTTKDRVRHSRSNEIGSAPKGTAKEGI